ncbi:MAG: hypothetical protein J0G37_09505 [Afipia sp.]|nr:hypothetical protein [Afipia sp.]
MRSHRSITLAIALAASVAALAPLSPRAVAQTATPAQMAEYQRKLADYTAIRAQFDEEASAYWSAVSDKRRARNAKRRSGEAIVLDDYVLTHPPVYSGPPRPVDPSAPPTPPKERKPIPVVADFLRHAQEQFQFSPRKPASEIEYKRAYARIASSFGLTKDQAVRIYSFESGGNGGYDVQAGLERANGRAISTALGYNQLLTTNTIDMLAEHGDLIVKALHEKARAATGAHKAALERKIATVQHMVAFTRTVPNTWSAHEKLGVTPRGIAVHALNLDVDVGPLLQTLKLMDSVNFARRKGFARPLTAAELEMMNLTGDGNGFDMVSMPQAMRTRVPTSNFFQRNGYERNPVAIRNNTVAKLLAATDARMDNQATLQGARDLAAAF